MSRGRGGMGDVQQWQEITRQIQELLGTMKFGSITLIVQDGKVIQIEKNEKIRLK
jgi:hypothetical protein